MTKALVLKALHIRQQIGRNQGNKKSTFEEYDAIAIGGIAQYW